MQYPSLNEARKYAEELLPTKSSIFKNGSTLYSNFKMLVLKREHTIPLLDMARCGILHQLSMFWYTTSDSLHLYSYSAFTTETISSFASRVQDVLCFEPIGGIFSKRISLCLLVITETDVMIYAVDNNVLVSTEFTARLPAPVCCVDIMEGRIYLGCANGRSYQAVYHAIDLLNYRYMSVYSPDSIIASICNVFKRKQRPVVGISASKSYLVVLGAEITVYRTSAGFYKEYSLPCTEEYVRVQIVEDAPLLFYCICKGGRRDFYEGPKLLSKDFPVSGSLYQGEAEDALSSREQFVTNTTMLLSYRPGGVCHAVFVVFNSDQLRNFSRVRPVENFEVLPIQTAVRSISISGQSMVVLGDRKLLCYDILDSRAFLLACRPQEIRTMYRNYGDVEFMVRYYELLAAGENVARLEGVCRNESAMRHALFIFIYGVVRPVFSARLSDILGDKASSSKIYLESEGSSGAIERVVSKLRMLRSKIPHGFEEAAGFVDEFVQTYFYSTLLYNYGIPVNESIEGIMLYGEKFKADSLRALLSMVSVNQSIEPLLKTMRDNCPLYLPLEQVNYQRGAEFLEKENTAFLVQSLDCFKNTRFDRAIISKYNVLGFYSGSVTLIRDKFSFSHEDAVSMLRGSVKCRGSMEVGLCSTDEAFLYPLFEVLLDLEHFVPCKCCETGDLSVDLLKIENPVFPLFLREQSTKNERACYLYWKYLLYRGKKSEAVKAIVDACGSDFPFDRKVQLLELALTVASGINPKSAEARHDWHGRINMMLRLSKIQSELVARDPTLKTNQLLSADSLYNDYCCDHPDLAIRVLDILGHENKKVLRELYVRHFSDLQFTECLAFLRCVNKKDLSLVIDLLAEKAKDLPSFCRDLLDCGFGHGEIIEQTRAHMDRAVHPSIREGLQKSLDGFSIHQRPADQPGWSGISRPKLVN